MSNILIVEDDEGLSRGITYTLEKEGHKTEAVATLQEARVELNKNNTDMVILDLNLPDGNGVDFCKEVRGYSNMPILMLTARNHEFDEVLGFDAGADDYMTKPFFISILKARVQSLLRRSGVEKANPYLQGGNILLDLASFKLYRISPDGGKDEITASATEFKLVKYFIENKGQVLLKDQMIEALWDKDGKFIDENTLAVNIRRLRKKIEEEPSKPRYIKTIHGLGYMWGDER